ncbi:alpha/beta fold hydrolase [Galactobacter valiniphilus]|uniref:alpha/beta fold hydrolase n=1 Tax=Galactobacter valiniphilus TaxID=2676122 RepID=UPI0037351548
MPSIVTRRGSSPGSRRAVATLATATLALTGILSAGGAFTQAPTADAASKVPNVKALAGDLSKQKLVWEKCDYQDSALNERFANIPNVLCATVKVPQDWKDPGNGKTWDIRISHAKNIDVKNARYKGTIFVNPGGPGGSGLPWAAAMQQRTPDLNPYYNYVGFDPRGVGQSSHAECEWEYDAASTDEYASLKAAGAACSQDPEVKTISTEQTTYDMDFIRTLLAAPKLSYIGYSYGTWLGAWYEKVFGAKYGDKFVLDSSTDVTDATLQQTWDLQPIARDRQFQYHAMGYIARNNATYELGTDREDIYKRYFAATKDVDPSFLSFLWALLGGAGGFSNNDNYPATADTVKFFINYAESQAANGGSSSAASGNPAADALKALESYTFTGKGISAQKVAEAKAALAELSKLKTVEQRTGAENAFEARTLKSVTTTAEGEPTLTKGSTSEAFDFIRCNDGQWTQGVNYWKAAYAKTAKKAPLTAQWGFFDAAPVCAFWRTNTTMPVADSTFPSTIVVQGELDSQTAWETGYTSGTQLPNTSFIAIDNEGSHGHFPYGTEAVDRPIFNFFLKGTQPKDIKVNQALPLPGETETFASFKKLNAQAAWKGVPADGHTPIAAPAQTAVGKQAAAADKLLQKAATQAETERTVGSVYGKKGVDVLRKHNNG